MTETNSCHQRGNMVRGIYQELGVNTRPLPHVGQRITQDPLHSTQKSIHILRYPIREKNLKKDEYMYKYN